MLIFAIFGQNGNSVNKTVIFLNYWKLIQNVCT